MARRLENLVDLFWLSVSAPVALGRGERAKFAWTRRKAHVHNALKYPTFDY